MKILLSILLYPFFVLILTINTIVILVPYLIIDETRDLIYTWKFDLLAKLKSQYINEKKCQTKN